MGNISQTHYIKYAIVKEAAGRSYGKNQTDTLDPREVSTLSQVIGNAGVNLTTYAAFFNYNFHTEVTDRNTPVKNKQTVIFVRRELLDLAPLYLVERWLTPKVLFDHY